MKKPWSGRYLQLISEYIKNYKFKKKKTIHRKMRKREAGTSKDNKFLRNIQKDTDLH